MAKLTKVVYDSLDAEKQAEVLTGLRDAVFHIASAWDALREVAVACEAHDVEVETDEVEGLAAGLAGDTTDPQDSYSISNEDLLSGFFGEAV